MCIAELVALCGQRSRSADLSDLGPQQMGYPGHGPHFIAQPGQWSRSAALLNYWAQPLVPPNQEALPETIVSHGVHPMASLSRGPSQQPSTTVRESLQSCLTRESSQRPWATMEVILQPCLGREPSQQLGPNAKHNFQPCLSREPDSGHGQACSPAYSTIPLWSSAYHPTKRKNLSCGPSQLLSTACGLTQAGNTASNTAQLWSLPSGTALS